MVALTHSCTHSLTHPLIYSPTYPLTHSPTHPLTHSPTHSLTHSFTHSLTYPLTHSPHPLPPSLTHSTQQPNNPSYHILISIHASHAQTFQPIRTAATRPAARPRFSSLKYLSETVSVFRRAWRIEDNAAGDGY